MGYRLFKIVAIGCGKATPTLSIRYQLSPDSPKTDFAFVSPTYPSDALALINAARMTATAAVFRNLHLSVLQSALPDVLAMGSLRAIRFDQCRMSDLLMSLDSVKKEALKKIEATALENTEMTLKQLMTFLEKFSGLKILTLTGVVIVYPECAPPIASPCLSLNTLTFSPRPTSFNMPIWMGKLLSQLFPNITKMDLSSFPHQQAQLLPRFVLEFNHGVRSKGKVAIILGQHPFALHENTWNSLNVIIQRADFQIDAAWKMDKLTVSDA